MKFELFFVGKTSEKYLQEGIDQYVKRLQHYLPLKIHVIPPSTNTNKAKVLEEESEAMLKRLDSRDLLVLLDENGTVLTSVELAAKMQKWMLESHSKVVFITGGAYGFSESLRQRANFTLSASRLTFTHQMIRLILVEQLYRAMTIVRNESYHHG
jgi:23S rRNA (pseudouridine1915-N3)-methyltransferase